MNLLLPLIVLLLKQFSVLVLENQNPRDYSSQSLQHNEQIRIWSNYLSLVPSRFQPFSADLIEYFCYNWADTLKVFLVYSRLIAIVVIFLTSSSVLFF